MSWLGRLFGVMVSKGLYDGGTQDFRVKRVKLPRADRNATFFESQQQPPKRAARRAAAKAKEAVRLAKARKDCCHEG